MSETELIMQYLVGLTCSVLKAKALPNETKVESQSMTKKYRILRELWNTPHTL